MIVSAPTALYQSILPKVETDIISVTWTISSNNPPRPKTTVPVISPAVENQALPPKIYDSEERRAAVGELVFGVSSGTQSQVGSGMKMFEVGQILEFEPVDSGLVVEDLLVPAVVDVQQNTNILDLSEVGLTQDEIDSLSLAARQVFDQLVGELNATMTESNDVKIKISDNQRLLNETQKIISASNVVFAGSTNNPLLAKLREREQQLLFEREEFVARYNVLTVTAQNKYNQIINLKELVR